MKLSKNTLEAYVAGGWLISQRHPVLPLTIYNYSQSTQYEGKWDDITLTCRGLVMDDMGNVVARPFKKFFNIEENRHSSTDSFEVYEKMDGSLGIFFYYMGEPVFASRGSFTSEQAVKGRELLEKYDWKNGTYEGYTYLFEIIYPENRIVVDYGNTEELIVLGVIETVTGKEVSYTEMETEGFKIVKRYDFTDYAKIKELNWENSEGFVVRFSNGDRCKIKFADYVKLHHVLTNCSSYDIWENLRTFNKLPEHFLTDVPDEFYSWVKGIEGALRGKYAEIMEFHSTVLASMITQMGPDHTKKEVALSIKSKTSVNPSILFALYNNKIDVAKDLIWKMIKPKYEKPFENKC